MPGLVAEEIGDRLAVKWRHAVRANGVTVAPFAVRATMRMGQPAHPEFEC
jgi:hypothetical protein